MGILESFLDRVWAYGLKGETAQWPWGGGKSWKHHETYLSISWA